MNYVTDEEELAYKTDVFFFMASKIYNSDNEPTSLKQEVLIGAITQSVKISSTKRLIC